MGKKVKNYELKLLYKRLEHNLLIIRHIENSLYWNKTIEELNKINNKDYENLLLINDNISKFIWSLKNSFVNFQVDLLNWEEKNLIYNYKLVKKEISNYKKTNKINKYKFL